MNTIPTEYAAPEAQTRHDSVATVTVLAAMLVCALSGAFVVEADPAALHATDAPVRYAAVEEARR